MVAFFLTDEAVAPGGIRKERFAVVAGVDRDARLQAQLDGTGTGRMRGKMKKSKGRGRGGGGGYRAGKKLFVSNVFDVV